MSGKHRRRKGRAEREREAQAEHRRRNPWLIGAIVRVLPSGGNYDKDKTGSIEEVVANGESDVHIVTVRLRDGAVVRFLGNQLVLI